MSNDIKTLNTQVAVLKQFVDWNLSADYDSRDRLPLARQALAAATVLAERDRWVSLITSLYTDTQPMNPKTIILALIDEYGTHCMNILRGSPVDAREAEKNALRTFDLIRSELEKL